MDTKKVQALLAAIDRGSLTAAANYLGYTQSGITQMMNSLEAEIGLSLLIRSKSGVRLSPAGQELLPEMQRLVRVADNLEYEADKLRQRNVSTLRLGAYSSIARHWVPQIVSEYRQVCPDTIVSITMDGLLELYSAVRNDELDCIMTSYYAPLAQGLHWIPLQEDELVAVLPSNYKLDAEAIPVERFDHAPFFMPTQGFDRYITPIFSAAHEKTSPTIINTNLDDETIVSMVEHGQGTSILTRLVVSGMPYKVRTVSLAPQYFRSLGIIVSERHINDKNIRRFIHCSQDLIVSKAG